MLQIAGSSPVIQLGISIGVAIRITPINSLLTEGFQSCSPYSTMNILKSLATAVVSTALFISPASARVEENTQQLINTMISNGIDFEVNSSDCNGNFFGRYRFASFRREMDICTLGDDAMAHRTVRHETMHAIQHCVNTHRGTESTTPAMIRLSYLLSCQRSRTIL